MDKSETYVKMSDHLKIQEEWKPENGDFFQFSHDPCSRDDPARGGYIEYGFGIYNKKDIHFGELLWLPYQHQIQEMIPQCNCPTCLIEEFYNFYERNIEGFFEVGLTSMEQLWLAFYMYEKHGLIWNGKKWKDE